MLVSVRVQVAQNRKEAESVYLQRSANKEFLFGT